LGEDTLVGNPWLMRFDVPPGITQPAVVEGTPEFLGRARTIATGRFCTIVHSPLYDYNFSLNSSHTARSFTLPGNNLVVLAFTLR